MRRLVVLGIVAMLALTLTGCGGGGNQAAQPAQGEGAGAEGAAPAAPVAPAGPSVTDRSIPESRTFEPFPTGEFIPKDVSDRIAEKQPMLLFFYDASQKATNDQRGQIDTVLNGNRGLVDLVAYDIGKYSSVDGSGTASTQPAILKDKSIGDAVLLARALKVTYTPYIVIVDQQGYVTFRQRGPIDAGLLEPEVLRAAK